MKKIMVLFAVAAMAIATHAASFKWSAANIYGPDGQKLAVGNIVSLHATSLDGATDFGVVDTYTIAAAGIVNQNLADAQFSSDSLVGGSKYNFFFTIEANGKEFTSQTVAVNANTTTTAAAIGFGNMATATQSADNWKGGSSDTPEPTSGMLLLLGLAGLALRRKQA